MFMTPCGKLQLEDEEDVAIAMPFIDELQANPPIVSTEKEAQEIMVSLVRKIGEAAERPCPACGKPRGDHTDEESQECAESDAASSIQVVPKRYAGLSRGNVKLDPLRICASISLRKHNLGFYNLRS
jgi:hypothetical protein